MPECPADGVCDGSRVDIIVINYGRGIRCNAAQKDEIQVSGRHCNRSVFEDEFLDCGLSQEVKFCIKVILIYLVFFL